MLYYAKWVENDGRFSFSTDQASGGVPVTEEQHAALLKGLESGQTIVRDAKGNPTLQTSQPTTAQQWAFIKAKAKAALAVADQVAVRCVKAEVMYPAEWKAYDAELRAIINASTNLNAPATLPAQPDYPAGT